MKDNIKLWAKGIAIIICLPLIMIWALFIRFPIKIGENFRR